MKINRIEVYPANVGSDAYEVNVVDHDLVSHKRVVPVVVLGARLLLGRYGKVPVQRAINGLGLVFSGNGLYVSEVTVNTEDDAEPVEALLIDVA